MYREILRSDAQESRSYEVSNQMNILHLIGLIDIAIQVCYLLICTHVNMGNH